MDNDNLPIDLTEFKNRLGKMVEFCTKLEDDLFNYEKIKKLDPVTKEEYYKLAKGSLMQDLNFIKGLASGKMSAEDEMLKNVIISLNLDQKKDLKDILMNLMNKKRIK